MQRSLLNRLVTLDVGSVYHDEPLARHCSWEIGGPADLLLEPRNAAQVSVIVAFAARHNIPLLVIGQGTNLLFDDRGVRGIVLKIGSAMDHLTIDGNRIVADAGAWVPEVARKAAKAGLVGLEHAIGIPGTLGGLVLMNGGSHRKGIGDNVRRVWVVDRDGREAILSREDCSFSYRHSALQESGGVIVRVELECRQGNPALVRREMIGDLRDRRRKFPRKQPNCGSVFLSTSQMHATVGPPGKIIEDAGLKGARIGNAQVSVQHANFIVNLGGATSADVLSLIARIRQVVFQKIGFDMHCEVRYVRPDACILPADQAEAVVQTHKG